MATNQSAVGTQLGELYASINEFQTTLNTIEERHEQERTELANRHKEELTENNAQLDKAKAEFASYLKLAGIDKLLTPSQAPATTNPKGKGKQADLFPGAETKTRKPRTNSNDVKANIALAKSVFTSTYELGIDEKTGLPKRHRGRNQQANVDIDRMMNDDAAAAGYKVVINDGRRELEKLADTEEKHPESLNDKQAAKAEGENPEHAALTPKPKSKKAAAA